MTEKTAGDVLKMNIMRLAEEYARLEGLSLQTVSRRFHGNFRQLQLLRDGPSSITMNMYDRMVQEFSDRWPNGAPWPGLDQTPAKRPKRNATVGKQRGT